LSFCQYKLFKHYLLFCLFVFPFADARNADFNKSAMNGVRFYAALLKLSLLKLRN